jgi:NTP pyrophosphatase (non-canonical NTP hydrolase)
VNGPRTGTAMPDDLGTLRDELRAFAAAREWAQFHSPKNLACALSVEAAELLEHFQWLTEDASRALGEAERGAVAHEAADVLLYLIQLADALGIDLVAAAREKIAINARKYPVESARGNSRKPGR